MGFGTSARSGAEGNDTIAAAAALADVSVVFISTDSGEGKDRETLRTTAQGGPSRTPTPLNGSVQSTRSASGPSESA